MPFLILFVGLPLLEIAVFIAVGDKIGLGMTLFLVLVTAILGGAVIRYQGFHILQSGRSHWKQGQLPGQELFDALCLLISGLTLITPGFVTDTIGLLLLLPPLRQWLFAKLQDKVTLQGGFGNFAQTRPPPKNDSPDVIEGDYEIMDEKDKKP